MIVFIVFFGCCLGSTVNVVAIRSIRGKNFITGRSECPHCGHVLSYGDMIPILSYIMLAGKCRYCRKTIAMRYLLTELWMGLVTVILYIRYELFEFGILEVMAVLLFLLALIDYEIMEVPGKLLVVYVLVCAVFLGYERYPVEEVMKSMLLNGSVSLFMWRLGGLGMADVIIITCEAAVAGFLEHTVKADMMCLLSAGIAAVYLLLSGKKRRDSVMPFIPFLCFGYTLYLMLG